MKNTLNLTVIAIAIISCFIIYKTTTTLITNQASVDKSTRDVALVQVERAEREVRSLFQSLREGVELVESQTLAMLAKANQQSDKNALYGDLLAEALFDQYVSIPNGADYNQIGVAFTDEVHQRNGVYALGLERSDSGYCFSQASGEDAWGQYPAPASKLANNVEQQLTEEAYTYPLPTNNSKEHKYFQARIVGTYANNSQFKVSTNSSGERVSHSRALERAITDYISKTSFNELLHSSKKQSLKAWLTELQLHTQHLVDWQVLAVTWNESSNANTAAKQVAKLSYTENSVCLVRYNNPKDADYYKHTDIEPGCTGKTGWYCKALNSRGWKKAAYGENAKKWLSDYSLPLIEPASKNIMGVAYGNISLMDARDQLSDLSLGAKGYAVLIGTEGNILSHPVKDYLTLPVEETNDARLKAILANLQELKKNKSDVRDPANMTPTEFSGFMSIPDQVGKKSDDGVRSSKLYVGASKIISPQALVPISDSGEELPEKSKRSYLQLIVVLDPTDFQQDNWQKRQCWLELILSCFTLICAVLFLLLRIGSLSQTKLSWYAATVSVLAIVALGLIWRVVYLYGADSDLASEHSSTEMHNLGLRAACYKHAVTLSKKVHSDVEQPEYCPELTGDIYAPEDFVPVYTEEDALAYLSVFNEDGSEQGVQRNRLGIRVFVQSLEFNSANNVSMTGYIWARFPDSFAGEQVEALTPVFPEAETVEFSDASSEVDASGNIHVRWYFTTTLRQTFDYRKYPFDREEVWIRIWPNDLYKNTVLTPEFSAYLSIAPQDTPGVEEDIVLDGWELVSSHFSYKKNNYNTALDTLGQGNNHIPELYFNVGLARLFVDPFIADMLPIVVVCLLVFAVLLITTVKEGDVELKGFSSANVLSYCAALYFVLIVSHVHLRETLNAFGIIYLEIFYFCMYFIILIVSANSLAITNEKTPAFIRDNDNYVARLSYFPFITLTLLIATVWMFY